LKVKRLCELVGVSLTENWCTMRIEGVNTRLPSSRTDCRIGISERPTGRPETVSATPRWSRRGPPSSVTCCRFTSIHVDWKHITRSELRTILFGYIETFYNRQRHQAGLQHHTPAEIYAASAVA
jgi:hypothetical protein